jgi:long-subunit fatty acid transport protein
MLIVSDTNLSGTATFEPVPPLDTIFGSSVPLSFLDSNGGDYVGPAFVPSMYAGMPLSDRLKVGFGFNGPWGVVSEPDHQNWAGQFEARTSELRTYNFNPVASYQLTPTLTVGAGAQVSMPRQPSSLHSPISGLSKDFSQEFLQTRSSKVRLGVLTLT